MTVKTKTLRKHCRALGVNLIGTPSAALTLQRRPNRPGQHGAGRRAKLSPFAMQLMETQKLKHYYGVTAKQLKRYYDRASMLNFEEVTQILSLYRLRFLRATIPKPIESVRIHKVSINATFIGPSAASLRFLDWNRRVLAEFSWKVELRVAPR